MSGPFLTIADLTPTQQRVAMAIAEGFPRKEIFRALAISEKTYDSHRSAVMRRLGLKNDVELLHLAMHEGRVKPRDPRFYRPAVHGLVCGHGMPRLDCQPCKEPPCVD